MPFPGSPCTARSPARSEQPLRERGVQTAGDRVLGSGAVLGKERAHLERVRRTWRVRANHAQVQIDDAGSKARTASALASSTATQPGPLSTHSASRISPRWMPSTDARCSISDSSTGPDRINGGAANASPSGVWRTRTRPAAHCWTTTSSCRASSRAEPGVARAERRVPGKRQLERRREDADLIVRTLDGRRQHKRRLGQVGPVGEPLHLVRREARGVEHDRDWIAAIGRGGEDVDLAKRAQHGEREDQPRSRGRCQRAVA